MSTPEDVVKLITEREIAFVDFRFTDTLGKEHHLTIPAHTVDEEKLETGVAFDGSSIAGWKGIEASDMRSEEHTSELQSLVRISYAVFCLKKKTIRPHEKKHNSQNNLSNSDSFHHHQTVITKLRTTTVDNI